MECFGANEFGQCGIGMNTPVNVALPSMRIAAIVNSASDLAVGARHACALVEERVRCWGANTRGQIGTGSTSAGLIAMASVVANLTGVSDVQAGGDFTCALSAGRVWCWGANQRGQFGDGTFTDRAFPVAVQLPPSESFAEVVTGEEHACARANSGRVFCWGSNHLG